MLATHSISEVTVYARGALVTRRTAELEAAPGDLDVILAGITPLAAAGSFRVKVEGASRRIASVHAELVVPEQRMTEGPSLARISELSADRERKVAERTLLGERRAALAAAAARPDVRAVDTEAQRRDKVADRFGEAVLVLGFGARALADIDERVVALSTEIARLERELAALEVASREASRASDWSGHPTRSVRVRLVGGEGPFRLAVTYAVGAACWWPSHTIRLGAGGTGGQWLFEALVAQATHEDWTDVKLALSSADLERSTTLPELRSLRFGRAQAKERRGFRRAPEGLDAMFGGFDRAFPSPPAPHTSRRLAAQAHFTPAPGFPEADLLAEAEESELAPLPRQAGPGANAPEQARLAAPPMQAMPMGMAMPQAARAKSRGGLLAAGAAMVAAPAVLAASAIGGAFGSRDEGAIAEEPAEDLDPGEDWLDFDRLALAGVDGARRGRLALADDAGRERDEDAVRRVEAAREHDFRDKRGMYDHRYDAAERAAIASDARPRRVTVALAAVSPTMTLRAAPLLEPTVFREARVPNPFPFPVLGGNTQVLVEGTLVAETEVDHTDRGGEVRVGCGTEERVRVVRNVRASEETAGLLGGSLAVKHDVSIEVASGLGYPVELVVLDRIPITEDKAIDIGGERSSPRAEAYDQAERGAPVKGGRLFRVPLAAGASATLELSYVLTFSSKLEIAGGNRRG